jgi:hypothetical protein
MADHKPENEFFEKMVEDAWLRSLFELLENDLAEAKQRSLELQGRLEDAIGRFGVLREPQ